MLASARAALAIALAGERDTSVTIKRGAQATSAIGGDYVDWSSPVTVTTATAKRQPASSERLQRAGLQQLVDAEMFYLSDLELLPETHRLYVGSDVYRVVQVTRWDASHVEAICEVITDG